MPARPKNLGVNIRRVKLSFDLCWDSGHLYYAVKDIRHKTI